jgi:hypothetical protein
MTDLRTALVAIVGPAGVGKSTIAQELCSLGRSSNLSTFRRQRFAGPLKDMLIAFGLTREQVDGDQKEVPCELLCGHTPRDAMRWLGTEYGRAMIGEDVWVRAAMRRVERDLLGGFAVVIDDCRFDNEAEAIRELGGIVVALTRDGISYSAEHASETGISPHLVTYGVPNNTDPEDVARNIAWLLKHRPTT